MKKLEIYVVIILSVFFINLNTASSQAWNQSGHMCTARGYVKSCRGKLPYRFCHTKMKNMYGVDQNINFAAAKALQACKKSLVFSMAVSRSRLAIPCKVISCR